MIVKMDSMQTWQSDAHVVALCLQPVQRLLGAHCAVGRVADRLTVGGVRAAAAGDLGRGNRLGGRGSSDVALEAVHIN